MIQHTFCLLRCFHTTWHYENITTGNMVHRCKETIYFILIRLYFYYDSAIRTQAIDAFFTVHFIVAG
jgi:hypothetical protein